MKGINASPDASGICRIHTLANPFGSFGSIAITTIALFIPRPHFPPCSTPLTKASSISIIPDSDLRSLRTPVFFGGSIGVGEILSGDNNFVQPINFFRSFINN